MDYMALAESAKFKKFYRLLCKTTGITLVLAPPSTGPRIPLDYNRNIAPLCSYLRQNPSFCRLCLKCDQNHCDEAVAKHAGFCYLCHIGLIDIVVPIFIDHRHIGTFMGGQVLANPATEENFAEFFNTISSFNFDKHKVRKLYFQTPYMPPERLDAAFELIKLFAEYFFELGPRLLDNDLREPALEKAKRFIYENYTTDLSLEVVAEKMGYTPTYFSRWFQQKCGIGFLEFLQQRRIEKACKLLKTTTFDISRIAYDSGFGSLTTFNRVFRKFTKQNPRDYRRNKTNSV